MAFHFFLNQAPGTLGHIELKAFLGQQEDVNLCLSKQGPSLNCHSLNGEPATDSHLSLPLQSLKPFI